MASRAKPPAGGRPEVVGQIVSLPVADIEIGERLRSIDHAWAAALGKVMKAEGQHSEIEVCQLPGRTSWLLVAGAHRLTGHRIEGMPHIRAKIVENDPAARIAREISQELWRSNLDPLARASFIASQVALLKTRAGVDPTKDGRTASANARWQKVLEEQADDATETISGAYGFADEVGELLGLTSRTIRNDLMLQRIAPPLIARLRERAHPALRNAAQLRALAKLDEEAQAAAVDRLLWEEDGGDQRRRLTLTEAIAAGKAKNAVERRPDDKRLSAFIGNFSRMGLGEKKGALAQLATVLPAGYSLTYGEQPKTAEMPQGYDERRDEAIIAIDDARRLIDGLLEALNPGDPVTIDGDRWSEIYSISNNLRRTRLSISADELKMDAEGLTRFVAQLDDAETEELITELKMAGSL